MSDPFRLERFVIAQQSIFEEAREELRKGRKSSHWMWFIFPQLKGLGHSSTAQEFGIASREEARAYLKHPVLGPRLLECVELVNHLTGISAEEIFGYPDYLKFRSSMTLFAEVSGEDNPFDETLQKYFTGQRDPLTLERL